MAITLEQALATPALMESFSRIRSPQNRFSKFFGFDIGGGNCSPVGSRDFQYDIYDKTRRIASFRSPGTPAGTVSAQPVGAVYGRIPRVAEKVPLLHERIFNNRPVGGPRNEIDRGGEKYIADQQRILKHRFENNREFMVSRMLRGSFQVVQSGDDWIPVDSGGTFTVDYKIPAGNKSQLNMDGAGSIIDATWANAGTNIITQCLAIQAAFEQLHGWPLEHVWVNSKVWGYVINNTQVKSLAGTSSSPFSAFEYEQETGDDGQKVNAFLGRLKAIPWLHWHIYDGGLDVGTTPAFNKFLPDTAAVFMPSPDKSWCEMLEGPEPVKEGYSGKETVATGFYAYAVSDYDPPKHVMHCLDNALPALKVPKAIAYGTVVF